MQKNYLDLYLKKNMQHYHSLENTMLQVNIQHLNVYLYKSIQNILHVPNF